jgi:hypothetical protein
MTTTVTPIDAPFEARYELWKPSMQLRQIVPTGTTADGPKLQQLWIEQNTGAQNWRSVSREVVTDAEFFAA